MTTQVLVNDASSLNAPSASWLAVNQPVMWTTVAQSAHTNATAGPYVNGTAFGANNVAQTGTTTGVNDLVQASYWVAMAYANAATSVAQASMWLPVVNAVTPAQTGYDILAVHERTAWRSPDGDQARMRRALWRSMRLYARLRGWPEIQAFARGEAVTIQGCALRYEVRARGSLIDGTRNHSPSHTPFDLRLLDAAGFAVSSGCIVMRETPVVDQLLAFVLAVTLDPAEEREMLARTNWMPRLTAAVQARVDAGVVERTLGSEMNRRVFDRVVARR